MIEAFGSGELAIGRAGGKAGGKTRGKAGGTSGAGLSGDERAFVRLLETRERAAAGRVTRVPQARRG